MSLALHARYVLRELRGAKGRLAFFAACLAVGVAAVVSVSGLADAIDRAIRDEARGLLAADLAVSGMQALPEELDALLDEAGALESTEVRTLFTLVANGETSRLTELKVVEGAYPFYGVLELSPSRKLDSLLDDSSVVVAPDLLKALDARVGDALRIGGKEFRIAGSVVREPDRVVMSFALAPRVFMNAAALERAGLDRYGSRVREKRLVRMPDTLDAAGLESAKRLIEEGLPNASVYRVESWRDAQPVLRSGLSTVESYLGLVALLSLLVGGVGVAQAIRAWMASRMDAIAILRCLGMEPRRVLALYLAEAALFGFAGSVVGVIGGIGMQMLVPRLLSDVISPDFIDPLQPFAMLRGLVLGVVVTLLFAAAPLASVLRVPPIRVFRRDAEPLPVGRSVRVLSGALLLVGIFLIASAQSGSLLRGGAFTLGISAVFGVLAGAALLLMRAVRAWPKDRAPVWTRHGLASIARPGAATIGAVVALGIGVTVVLAMYLVEGRLSAQLGTEVPDDAPSVFIVDIQPDQWEGVRAVLEESGARGIDSLPMVTGRLSAIDGRPVTEIIEEREASGDTADLWTLRREQRMTYAEVLPEDNVIVEGELWSRPDVGEVSVEVDFAREIGAELGSVLTFDIQGVPVEVTITSLRTVDWQTFGINFFMTFEPSALEEAPHTRVAVARVPDGGEQALQDAIAAEHPNVTVVQVREILDKVRGVLEKLGFGVRLLGGFAVLAGLAILGGAVTAGSMRRRREVALLKTLGMTRAGVLAVFSLEYLLLGVVAGLIGTVSGAVMAWAVVTQGMRLPWAFEPLALSLGVGVAALLSLAGGLAASFGALGSRPIEILRAE